MGHIAHPRNQSKSMNKFEASYDFLYVFYQINPVVQEGEIFKFPECVLAISSLSSDVKRCCLSIWKNLNPLPQGWDAFC